MTTNTFSYNGFGARVSAVDSSGTRTFARNGTGVTAPVLGDGMANYTPGVSERRGGVTRHQSSDIKNATQQVSSSQTVVGAQQYDAFGNLTSSTGSWNGPFSYGGAFGYQTETDTGYQLLGHRYYDPTTGRFLTRDPIGDGRNWYTYCGNNPVTAADPDGLRNIIIRGDDTGVLGSGIGYWWEKPWKGKGDIEIVNPTKKRLIELLINADEGDVFFFWGHGDEQGKLYLGNGEYLTQEDIEHIVNERKKRGKGKLKRIELRACYSAMKAEWVNRWLQICDELIGFPGVTGEQEFPQKIYGPRSFRRPIASDPGDEFDAAGKKKRKKGKQHATLRPSTW